MRRTILTASLISSVVFLVAARAAAQPQPAPVSEAQPAYPAAPAQAYPASPVAYQASPAPTYASSSGRGHGVGVGAVTMLGGMSGALVSFGSAGGAFHIDGMFGLRNYRVGADTYTTDVALGGRFWYHLHAASFADFSVGGGLAFISWTQNPGANNSNAKLDVAIQAGGQIRAFVVPNVALIADLGIGAYFGDGSTVRIGGQASGGGVGPADGHGDFLSGSLGIVYFFE